MNDNMFTSQHGLEFIAKWEACILKPYRDVAGLRTIGVGHLIKPGENFPDGELITRERALEILAGDVGMCEAAIKSAIKVSLNQNQFDALVSFGFNCGTGVYSSSEACKALNLGKYEDVPALLLNWCKARVGGQLVVVKGLYNRRKSEGELFIKEEDQDASSSVLTEEEKMALQAQVALSLQKMSNEFIDSLSVSQESSGVSV
jgi:lysozyme